MNCNFILYVFRYFTLFITIISTINQLYHLYNFILNQKQKKMTLKYANIIRRIFHKNKKTGVEISLKGVKSKLLFRPSPYVDFEKYVPKHSVFDRRIVKFIAIAMLYVMFVLKWDIFGPTGQNVCALVLLFEDIYLIPGVLYVDADKYVGCIHTAYLFSS